MVGLERISGREWRWPVDEWTGIMVFKRAVRDLEDVLLASVVTYLRKDWAVKPGLAIRMGRVVKSSDEEDEGEVFRVSSWRCKVSRTVAKNFSRPLSWSAVRPERLRGMLVSTRCLRMVWVAVMKAMLARPSCMITAMASAPRFGSVASSSCFSAMLSQLEASESFVRVKFRRSSRSRVWYWPILVYRFSVAIWPETWSWPA